MEETQSRTIIGELTRQDEIGVEECKLHNIFIYALYNYLTDPTAVEKKEKVLGAATSYAKITGQLDLVDQVKIIMPLLVGDNENAWVQLLCWIGKHSHMFVQFKDASPFKRKILARIRFDQQTQYSGRLDANSLPQVDCLWRIYGAQSDDIVRRISSLVLVIPSGIAITVFEVNT